MTAARGGHASTLSRFGSIDEVAERWEELADRAAASPFLRPGWFSAWTRAFGGSGLEILALADGERIRALVPMSAAGGALRSPTNWHTPEFGLLAEDEDARSELAVALFAAGARSVSLGFLEGGAADIAALRRAARATGEYRTLARRLERSPYVAIDGATWPDHLKAIGSHRRTELRRRRRRLSETGELAFALHDGRVDLDALLAEGFGIEGSGWKSRRGTSIESHPDTAMFYREVARWAASRDALRLAFLRLDRRAIAFVFLVVDGGRLYHLKGGYDPEYARYAPGTLIIESLLQHAFESGARSYEFLGDEEPFKADWTSLVRERLAFEAYRRSIAGAASWGLNRLARPAARRLVRALRR